MVRAALMIVFMIFVLSVVGKFLDDPLSVVVGLQSAILYFLLVSREENRHG